MESRGKRVCFVPFCRKDIVKNPDMVFFIVPKSSDLRQEWIEAAKRDPVATGPKSVFYCCQDHFDIDEDVENIDEYRSKNGKCRPVLKAGVIPHKFHCFRDKKVPSTFDLKKQKMILNEETISCFLEPFEDTLLDEQGAEGEVVVDEETRITLEEMNQLLLDVNNLGVLSSVLNAYNQVYDEETAWNIEFTVENSGNLFTISIKKVNSGLEPSDVNMSKEDCLENVEERNMEACNQVCLTEENFDCVSDSNCVEDEQSGDDDVQGSIKRKASETTIDESCSAVDVALIKGGHLYTNMMDLGATTRKKFVNSCVAGSPTCENEVLPKEKVATVYQCEYCCYGSLYKYRLVHHITTKHVSRFTKLPDDQTKSDTTEKDDQTEAHSRGNDTETNVKCGTGKVDSKPDCLPKRKRLSYYLTSERTQELNKLINEIRIRSDWLDGFLKSFDSRKVNSSPKNSSKIHPCTLCDFTASTQTEVYRHIGLSHTSDGSSVVHCPLCDFNATDWKNLVSHIKANHPEATSFQCRQCLLETKTVFNYLRHSCQFPSDLNSDVTVTHKECSFKCMKDDCGFQCLSERALNTHMSDVHQEVRPYACLEEDCDFTTGRQFLLDRHLYGVHGIGRPPRKNRVRLKSGSFPCVYCSKVFNRKVNLVKHVRHHHLGLRQHFRCSECDFSSTNKPSVYAHIREVHRGYFPFKCSHCDFKTSVRQKYQLHCNAVHLKQRPYQCPQCGLRFAQRPHINRHIRDVHLKEKPNLCAYCNFCTANRGNLKVHLKAIHKIPDERLKQVLKSCVNLRKEEQVTRQPDFNEKSDIDFENQEASQIIEQIDMDVGTL